MYQIYCHDYKAYSRTFVYEGKGLNKDREGKMDNLVCHIISRFFPPVLSILSCDEGLLVFDFVVVVARDL